jgi:hypothetical protein
MLHHKQVDNNLLYDKKQYLNFENVLIQLYPKSIKRMWKEFLSNFHHTHTCIVTRRSSICTSLVRTSTPTVGLHWLENLCATNRPIRLVFPTPSSPIELKSYIYWLINWNSIPKMMTLSKTFSRPAISCEGISRKEI